FRSVRVHLEPEGAAERELVVEVEETPRTELFVEPGYGSYEGPRISFGVERQDLFGGPERLAFESSLSALAQGAKMTLTDPWLLSSDWTASVTTFASHRIEPAFTEDEIGAGIGASRQWSRELLTSVNYTYKVERVTDAAQLSPGESEADDDTDL